MQCPMYQARIKYGSIGNELSNVLNNYASPDVFEYISECENYESAMQVLESTFVVPKNETLARHLLATRRQQAGETLDAYLHALKLLAKDCQFKTVTAEVYKQEMIRDAFINVNS